MKKNIFKYLLGAGLAVSVLSCSKLVDDITSDPDLLVSEDVNAKNVLQGAILNNQFFQTAASVRTSTMWMNQATGMDRQYISVEDWNKATAGDFDDSWRIGYVALSSEKDLQAKSAQELNYKTQGVGKVLEAFTVGTLTSLFGDIPYSEFDSSGKNMTPKFDAQKDVYVKIQKTLDEAIANLGQPGKIDAAKDLVYAGDASKWIKAAYSLKARYYLHVKDYANAKANALKGISSPAEDYMAKFGDTYAQSFNPWGSFIDYDRYGYIAADGSYAVALLNPDSPMYRGNAKTDESARFQYTYIENSSTSYDLNYQSTLDYGVKGRFGVDTDVPLLTYGEMLLVIAEADTRLSGVGVGLVAYNKYRDLLSTGYLLSKDYLSEPYMYEVYDAADFASGGMENKTGLTPQNALISEILQERYVYFIGNYESFTDYRRTNNGAGIVLKKYSGSPERFLYSQAEINANPNAPKPIPAVTEKTPVNK